MLSASNIDSLLLSKIRSSIQFDSGKSCEIIDSDNDTDGRSTPDGYASENGYTSTSTAIMSTSSSSDGSSSEEEDSFDLDKFLEYDSRTNAGQIAKDLVAILKNVESFKKKVQPGDFDDRSEHRTSNLLYDTEAKVAAGSTRRVEAPSLFVMIKKYIENRTAFPEELTESWSTKFVHSYKSMIGDGADFFKQASTTVQFNEQDVLFINSLEKTDFDGAVLRKKGVSQLKPDFKIVKVMYSGRNQPQTVEEDGSNVLSALQSIQEGDSVDIEFLYYSVDQTKRAWFDLLIYIILDMASNLQKNALYYDSSKVPSGEVRPVDEYGYITKEASKIYSKLQLREFGLLPDEDDLLKAAERLKKMPFAELVQWCSMMLYNRGALSDGTAMTSGTWLGPSAWEKSLMQFKSTARRHEVLKASSSMQKLMVDLGVTETPAAQPGSSDVTVTSLNRALMTLSDDAVEWIRKESDSLQFTFGETKEEKRQKVYEIALKFEVGEEILEILKVSDNKEAFFKFLTYSATSTMDKDNLERALMSFKETLQTMSVHRIKAIAGKVQKALSVLARTSKGSSRAARAKISTSQNIVRQQLKKLMQLNTCSTTMPHMNIRKSTAVALRSPIAGRAIKRLSALKMRKPLGSLHNKQVPMVF